MNWKEITDQIFFLGKLPNSQKRYTLNRYELPSFGRPWTNLGIPSIFKMFPPILTSKIRKKSYSQCEEEKQFSRASQTECNRRNYWSQRSLRRKGNLLVCSLASLSDLEKTQNQKIFHFHIILIKMSTSKDSEGKLISSYWDSKRRTAAVKLISKLFLLSYSY